MSHSEPTYITYLLRLWRSGEREPWRVSLQDPHTGDKHNFASLGLMLDFLSAQAGEGLLGASKTNDENQSIRGGKDGAAFAERGGK